jgi:hypothetical protein
MLEGHGLVVAYVVSWAGFLIWRWYMIGFLKSIIEDDSLKHSFFRRNFLWSWRFILKFTLGIAVISELGFILVMLIAKDATYSWYVERMQGKLASWEPSVDTMEKVKWVVWGITAA